MINHLSRFIVGVLILFGVYCLVIWIRMEFLNKIFWLLTLIISYFVGYSVEIVLNKKKKKKTFY